MKSKTVYFLCLSLFFIWHNSDLQGQDMNVQLFGHVLSITDLSNPQRGINVILDTPVPSKQVIVSNQKQSWDAESSMNGYFTIEGIMPGISNITVESGGSLQGLSEDIVLSPGMHFLFINLRQVLNNPNTDESEAKTTQMDLICSEKNGKLVLLLPLFIQGGGQLMQQLKSLPGVSVAQQESSILEEISFSSEFFRWARIGEIVLITPTQQ